MQASHAGARIPSGPASRVFDIKYYTRDTVSTPLAGDSTADASLSAGAAAELARPQFIDAPKTGSPGAKNPAVERYDPTGLRSAMTTTHAAVAREIALARERHTPRPAWERAGIAPMPNTAGRPVVKRVNAWGHEMTNDW